MIDLRAARANPARAGSARPQGRGGDLRPPARSRRAMAGARPRRRRPARAHEAQREADPRAARSAPGGEGRAQEVEEALAAAEAERDALALRIPNPPRDDVPDGSTEDDVVELRRVGEPAASADPHDHLELGRVDMERAARMSGARFGYWIGDTARLALALYRLALDRLAAAGFVTVLPPVLVREGALIGTGASHPTRRTSTSSPPTTSTSPGRPRSRSPASTPARSSRATSSRSATSRSHRASAARRAPRDATRAG